MIGGSIVDFDEMMESLILDIGKFSIADSRKSGGKGNQKGQWPKYEGTEVDIYCIMRCDVIGKNK